VKLANQQLGSGGAVLRKPFYTPTALVAAMVKTEFIYTPPIASISRCRGLILFLQLTKDIDTNPIDSEATELHR
jgi:hypothetical protein